MALNPFCPGMCLHFQGQVYYQLQRYEEAENVLTRRIFRTRDRRLSCAPSRHLWPDGPPRRGARQWREVIRVNPAYSLEHGRKVLPYKNPADFETVVDGLKKAGSVE
jgi:adenylate cyclase